MPDEEHKPLFEVGEDKDIPIKGMNNKRFIGAVHDLMRLDPARFKDRNRLLDEMVRPQAAPVPQQQVPQQLPDDTDLSRFDDRLKNTLR